MCLAKPETNAIDTVRLRHVYLNKLNFPRNDLWICWHRKNVQGKRIPSNCFRFESEFSAPKFHTKCENNASNY